MKTKDLTVGDLYARKNSNRPYRLLSMQPWVENRKLWSSTVLAYHPAAPGASMRDYSYGGLSAVGRVVLIGPSEAEVEEVEIPEFLEEKATDDQDRTRLSEKFMAWKNGLPWGVQAELVNTVLLLGPYTEVKERRRVESERQFQLEQEADLIGSEWTLRLDRLQAAVEERGQQITEVRSKDVFPEVLGRRPATVELTIEAMEALLGL